jgi:formylglycine-generating enzyme required for sulfatase activity
MAPMTDLLDLLVNLPDVDTVDKRKAFVTCTGFAFLGAYLDWEGANVAFFPRLVNEISHRGQSSMVNFLVGAARAPQLRGSLDWTARLDAMRVQIEALPPGAWLREFPPLRLTARDRTGLIADPDMLAEIVVSATLVPYFALGPRKLAAEAGPDAVKIAADIATRLEGAMVDNPGAFASFASNPKAEESAFLANVRALLAQDDTMAQQLANALTPAAATVARPLEVKGHGGTDEEVTTWDVFVSHASEDKEAIARPLAQALEARGLRVWFDEFTLSVGDRLRRSIDQGLARSKYGIVILSPYFFAKEWPQKELDGLVQRENRGEKVILPVWHNISAEQIAGYSPSLADRIGVRSDMGLERVVGELLRGMRYTPPLLEVLSVTSPIQLELMHIPAGEFLMGSDPQVDKDAYPNEQPPHRLYLPDFYIGKHPVTVAQYAAFARATRRQRSGMQGQGDAPVTDVSWDDAPVTDVSWDDGVAFCRWLSKRSGRAFRLPTEAEWEKAARGADGRIYPWGKPVPTTSSCNFDNYVGHTTRVWAYPAGTSPYGVLDMAGNVWEWTNSGYRDYPYRVDDGREGPNEDFRVLRGGSFIENARVVRCACRNWYSPKSRLWDFGFRVVASPIIHDRAASR